MRKDEYPKMSGKEKNMGKGEPLATNKISETDEMHEGKKENDTSSIAMAATYRNLRARPPSRRLRIGTLARLRRDELPITVMRFPCAA